MKRMHQVVLIVSTLALSRYGMMLVHEFGHMLGAWTSGGTVERVHLHPLRFSETVIPVNPHPLWAVWAGPLFGVLLPVLVWVVAARFKLGFAYILRYFAGFCLLANGAYIGIGSFDHIADAGVMLDHGSSPWQLWLFGVVCLPLAFLLWHRQGTYFGLGTSKGKVNPRHAYAVLLLLVLLLTAESLLLVI